jgi:hypothetical protein
MAETALINLSFALAEIAVSGIEAENILRAAEHIRLAISDLKKLAPEFDEPADIQSLPHSAGRATK